MMIREVIARVCLENSVRGKQCVAGFELDVEVSTSLLVTGVIALWLQSGNPSKLNLLVTRKEPLGFDLLFGMNAI